MSSIFKFIILRSASHAPTVANGVYSILEGGSPFIIGSNSLLTVVAGKTMGFASSIILILPLKFSCS